MKAAKLLITLCVFLTTLLGGGIALALEPPILTVTTSGPTVSLSWTSVAGANGYTLYYAPYPYTGPDSIGNISMGIQTSMSASLWDGAAFYVAVEAYDSVETSGYSNIEYFIIGPYTNSLGQTFRLIPAGTFTMGSPSSEPGREGDDETQHQVTLTQPFYMQTTQVTQVQWHAVMGSNPSHFLGYLTLPVEMVSWNDVQLFITRMNLMGEGTYSLPTEAQWEYAARAGSTTAFYNGEITDYLAMNSCEYDSNLDAIGWYCYNAGMETHPVAGKAPNAWGLYDMSGNVLDWCQDWYSSSYYTSSAVTDPTGPSSGSHRVLRGGSWGSSARHCRSAIRGHSSPSLRNNHIGFRLVWQP